MWDRFLSLSADDQSAFRRLLSEHDERMALPELPLLVWQEIAALLTFRDRLSVRVCCKRLLRLVPVVTSAVVSEHMGRFEVALRAYSRSLERLPLALLERVAIEPLVRGELDALAQCALPRLRELRVGNGGGVHTTSLASLALMTQLESLTLASSELDDGVFDVLLAPGLARLTALSCAVMWRMTATSLRRLAVLPALRSLRLEFCMSGAPGVVSCVCDGRELVANVLPLTQLRSLAVNSVVFAGPEVGALSALTNLEELRLRDAALHVPSSLAQLAALPRLHTLVLMFSRAPLQLASLRGLTALRRLALLGQFAASELAQLAHVRTLRALALRRLDATGDAAALDSALRAWDAGDNVELEEFSCWLQELDDAPSLAFLDALPRSLRRLRLSLIEAAPRIEAPLRECLAARLTALELLDLDQARASDATLARLVLAAGPRLRALSLFGCEALGDATLAAIGAACAARLEALCFGRILHGGGVGLSTLAPLTACTRLSQLWLSADRYIDDRALAPLVAAPQLALLDLSRCPAVRNPAALQRLMPHCRILLTEAEHDLLAEAKNRRFKFFDEI